MLIQFTPFVTRQRFAELVGVTDDTLERWIRDGRVSCFKMGKRSLVDLRVWINDTENTEGGMGASKPRLTAGAAPARSVARTAAAPAVRRAITPPQARRVHAAPLSNYGEKQK